MVSSSAFGACTNIIDAARQNNMKIKFRLNKDSLDVARAAALDKLVDMEEAT